MSEIPSSSTSEMEACLAIYFDPRQPQRSFTDDEIEDVRQTLEQYEHTAHTSPRTYIIFRLMDRLDVLDKLLKKGWDDYWIPFESNSAISTLLDRQDVQRMIEIQQQVLARPLGFDGRHCHYGASAEQPFVRRGCIAEGGTARIYQIESKSDNKTYALKIVGRVWGFNDRSKTSMSLFQTELQILKRLNHQHIVRYIGSYTAQDEFGLIISPLAQCNLQTFLQASHLDPSARPILRKFFGCLATALSYLHAQEIKHRDIKPLNILVHDFNVYIADFGISREHTHTTTGYTPMTLRYCSPEVAKRKKRNWSTDIWSLGIVFLEITAAIQGCTSEHLNVYYQSCGTKCMFPYENPEATIQLLQKWETEMEDLQAKPLEWIRSMLVLDRKARPTAANICHAIMAESSPGSMYCCEQCYYSPPSIFELPLEAAVLIAGQDVGSSTFVLHKKPVTSLGRVPTIVVKCVEYLVQHGFTSWLNPSHGWKWDKDACLRLKEEFKRPPMYGQHLDWTRYSPWDALNVLSEYLGGLLEPLISEELISNFPPLNDYQQLYYAPSEASLLDHYATQLRKLPSCNLHLLLYLVSFLATSVDTRAAKNWSDFGWTNRAAAYYSSALCRDSAYRFETFTLLIVNAGYFLSSARGEVMPAAEWAAVIENGTAAQKAEQEAYTKRGEDFGATLHRKTSLDEQVQQEANPAVSSESTVVPSILVVQPETHDSNSDIETKVTYSSVEGTFDGMSDTELKRREREAVILEVARRERELRRAAREKRREQDEARLHAAEQKSARKRAAQRAALGRTEQGHLVGQERKFDDRKDPEYLTDTASVRSRRRKKSSHHDAERQRGHDDEEEETPRASRRRRRADSETRSHFSSASSYRRDVSRESSRPRRRSGSRSSKRDATGGSSHKRTESGGSLFKSIFNSVRNLSNPEFKPQPSSDPLPTRPKEKRKH